ncbi:ABC transporter ATP-binding protein [Streptomyces sp. MUM 136J]|uniref:ABC transporter ATP-binding protein n=1 Tax=Streptomyces sp. MUM 136J TaxID=2791992 RepID=UPI001F04DB78|nr:ABC transporter ATP-binding protein [Streptomyces sp. MUM 136J]MCH0569142.1 ABC transporter ATP-binding protein [Streptomyces sp. MUM 136J]
MALLEVTGLDASYGAIEALSGVSLRVEPGEIVAILGANGAGKTTLLRTLTGLHRAKAGTVLLDGQDITRRRAHDIVGMGFGHVPEGRRVFAALEVDGNLTMGGYQSRKDPAALAERRLQVYGLFPRLAERQGQLAGTLSGGEQQMLAIGRALMNAPRFLALDEPSLGLSPLFTRNIFKIVRRIREQGTAVLLVEQNARQALRLADRAYVLETGRVALEGPAAELADDPRVKAAYLGGAPAEPSPTGPVAGTSDNGGKGADGS